MVRSLFRYMAFGVGSALFGLVLVGLALYVRFLSSGPELEPWHQVRFEAEFTARRAAEITTLEDYRGLEDRLFDEVRTRVVARVDPADPRPFNRFHAGSRSDPGTWSTNWNRTFELGPAQAPGGVLLLHGLTDSPYSLRSIGEHLATRGFTVVGLRLPGHGTAPAGLLNFEVEDMQAAVRLAMVDIRRRLGPNAPIWFRYCSPETTPNRVLRPDFVSGSLHPRINIIAFQLNITTPI